LNQKTFRKKTVRIKYPGKIPFWKSSHLTYSARLEKKVNFKRIYQILRGENPCFKTFPYRKTIFGSVAQTGQI